MGLDLAFQNIIVFLEGLIIRDDVATVPEPPWLDVVAKEDSLYGLGAK